MADPTPARPNEDPQRPTLSYARPDLVGEGASLTTVARCAAASEAAVLVNALEAAGIRAVTTNENVVGLGIPYSGMSAVEVQVRRDDAEQAAEVLRLATSDEVEPADDQPETAPADDPDGDPVPLEVVGRFDQIRALRDAATLLESARIRAVPPKLVARTGPAGEGKRFHLRVREEDADRAEEVLDKLEEDDDRDEPRCPKCGSWRTYPVSQFKQSLLSMVGMAEKPVEQIDCLACKYRGPKSEFVRE